MCDCIRCGVPQGSVLGHLSFQLTSVTSPSSSKHIVNFLSMTQQSTAVTLISKSYWSHYRRTSTIYSLSEWAEFNHMSHHPDETRFMLVTTRQERQNLTLKCPPISIENQTFIEVDNHKVLGVTTDNNLFWSSHITALCKSTSKEIYQLSKIKHFLNFDARKSILSCPYSIHH